MDCRKSNQTLGSGDPHGNLEKKAQGSPRREENFAYPQEYKIPKRVLPKKGQPGKNQPQFVQWSGEHSKNCCQTTRAKSHQKGEKLRKLETLKGKKAGPVGTRGHNKGGGTRREENSKKKKKKHEEGKGGST